MNKKEIKAQKNKKWLAENPERALAYSKRYRAENKDKINARKKEFYNKNKDLLKNRDLIKKYNITLNDYNKMLEQQNYLCAICCEPETSLSNTRLNLKLAVDHCHTTGKIRKLLCGRCNKAIGLMRDREELFTATAKYLKEHSGQ